MASGPKRGAAGLGRALLDPLGLVVLGGAGAAFAATHLAPVLGVGGLAWAALVALKLLGKGEVAASAGDDEALPGPEAFLDEAVKANIRALHQAHQERGRVLKETPPALRETLRSALESARELEQHAVALASRAEGLNDYLRTQDRAAIAADAQRLSEAATKVVDAAARDEYGRAVGAKGEQLRALDDISAARERALANLSRIVSTLAALPTKIVRMRALDEAAQDALGSDVSRDLGHLNEEIRLFEKTLISLAERAP